MSLSWAMVSSRFPINIHPINMTNIKFLTWNVRGIRDRFKRTAVFGCLKSYRADIIVLVETHITGQLQVALKRPWIGWAYHATHSSYSRGVSILIAKTAPFGIISVRTDPQGRFIFSALYYLWLTIPGSCLLYSPTL